jgi:hypothetical protein
MAVTTIFKLLDKKGDRSTFSTKTETDNAEPMATFLAGKTHCGWGEYSIVSTEVVETPVSPSTATSLFNDVDVKAILTFRNVSIPSRIETVRVAIAAPITEVGETCICSRLTDEKRIVPRTKITGELGKDGATIATELETMLGLAAGDIQFSSGTFTKVRA